MLIEIGRDSGLSLATRRIAGTLTGISAILALIWIIRGPLGIQQYSPSLLLAGFSLGFLGRVFRTETISGAGERLSASSGISRGHLSESYWGSGSSAGWLHCSPMCFHLSFQAGLLVLWLQRSPPV